MSDVRFTEPAVVDYGDYAPDGSRQNGYVTTLLGDDVFAAAVRRHIRAAHPHRFVDLKHVLMTVTECWSGYSEYTVTNQWSEITISAPSIGYEFTWPSMGDFFRAMADANPEADRI